MQFDTKIAIVLDEQLAAWQKANVTAFLISGIAASEPALVGEIEFYGLFVGFACVALVAGAVAVITGRRRGDLTMRFGFIAVAYVLLAQLIQSLWD